MKNSLNKSAIERIGNSFAAAWPDFSVDVFTAQATEGVDGLELKMRVNAIIEVLAQHLPDDFEMCVPILYKVKDVWIKGDTADAYQVFAAWPVIDYVAVYGVNRPDLALPLLKHLTSLFSAEFAIRPFIEAHPQLCHTFFTRWIVDPDEHVRRLVSEGTRPRLPWASKLAIFIENPSLNTVLLAQLKDDSSLYVRRSVANHLNDIAKDHPVVVLDLCESWIKNANEQVKWLIKHATRGLVKQGNKRVYPLLGYTPDPCIEKVVLDIQCKQIDLGQRLQFKVSICSGAISSQNMVVDYAIGFMKANGVCRDKVFKLKNITISQKQTLVLDKSHLLKAITTRRYYSGVQTLKILINGVEVAKSKFELSC